MAGRLCSQMRPAGPVTGMRRMQDDHRQACREDAFSKATASLDLPYMPELNGELAHNK